MRIPLANLLVKSPLPRVGELMGAVRACADMLPKILNALVAGDRAGLDRLAKETSILEGRADTVKNLARAEMPARILLPVDRRDVLRLVSELDAIANCAEDIGVLLTLRPLPIPPGFETPVLALANGSLEAVAAAEDLVGRLNALAKAGFSGRMADETLELVKAVSDREHEADKLQDQCAKALFRHEEAIGPVALFMWMKVIQRIGDMANHAENVGDQFRLFVAR